MQHTEVDHLVVAARSLDEGMAWCRQTLGAEPQPGGRHAWMGTHNALVALSGEGFPRCYLELIAIDPQAPPPGRPRWFGLDQPALQIRLAEQGPRLVGYVARSAMIDMHRFGLLHSQLAPGSLHKASRDSPAGVLHWQVVVPDDGLPLAGGAVPMLVQWHGAHPADALPDSGVNLVQLTVRGLSDRAAQVLRLRRVSRAADAGPVLEARLATPQGEAWLA